ncbi:MAG: FHA domain-containing protein [Planctomycetota bacterium]|nr:FHA domain-containing protein [Planctomycetota bacterium]
MPVVLEIETGPQSGRKTLLRTGQSLEVGRGEETDFPVPSDPLISRRHFQVACKPAECLVRDLGSSNGTFLNGERMAEALLCDGDRIRAGNTLFVVRIQVPMVSVSPSALITADTENPHRAEGRTDGNHAAAAGLTDLTPPIASQTQTRTAFAVPAARIHDASAPLPALPDELPPFSEDSRHLQSVILETVFPDQRRRRWQLRAGQAATVGCGADADFVVDADRTMSSIHFELSTTTETCWIRDRQSHLGTLVNGQPVQAGILYHRDRIRAGQSEFVVAIQGGKRAPADPRDRRGGEFVLDARPDPTCRPGFIQETCPSGLTVFRGIGADLKPARVARLLARAAPLYALADFGRASLPLPADLKEPSLIYDCLPAEFAGESSPLLVADLDLRELDAVIAAAWGQDALVCLLSRQPKPALLEQLRTLAHASLPTGEAIPDGSCLGFCWPSVLELLLSHTPSDNVGRLLPGVEAYLLEAKPPYTWQIFGLGAFSAALARLGFVQQARPGTPT